MLNTQILSMIGLRNDIPKQLTILSLILIFLFGGLVVNAQATSGCCSWHSGVCGCSTSGRVICCDGSLSPTCTCTPSYSPPRPPVITSFTADSTTGDAPLTVTFTCAAYDSDGNIKSYEWDFDGDGNIDQTTEFFSPSVTHTYSIAGTYQARVTVVDNEDITSYSTLAVSVISTAVRVPPTTAIRELEPPPVTPICPTIDDPIAEPLAAGNVAVGGNQLNISVEFPEYEGPVDIYIGLDIPSLGLWTFNQINDLTPGIITPWRTNVIGPLSEKIISIPIYSPINSELWIPEGIYTFYSAVVPAGGDWTKYDITYYSVIIE